MKVVKVHTVFIFLGCVNCLNIVMERGEVVFLNDKYLSNASISVVRYGRRSPYYLNILGANKQTWANNVTINLVLYEYLHNEYRRSFVEFHYKLCDMLNSDQYVGAMIAKSGITCPVYPRMYYMVNLTVPNAGGFKYVWPFKRCKAELKFTMTETSELMAEGNIYVSFSDKKINL